MDALNHSCLSIKAPILIFFCHPVAKKEWELRFT